MNTKDFFAGFLAKVQATPHWKVMENTVEDSPWHREANVAVHTLMCIDQYMTRFYEHRTEFERMITLMALLFHDFGKPEAEETLEKKDEDGKGTGVMYRRYAGHEPISGNEFISFMMDHDELRNSFLAQGFTLEHLRQIKVMIEHHLPYGLKKVDKRNALREMIAMTLCENEECFYDMLRSDAAGRISDDHETKLANVETWITEFQAIVWKPTIAETRVKNGMKGLRPFAVSMNGPGKFSMDFTADTSTALMVKRQSVLTLVVGVSGVGKSTWIQENCGDALIFSEDELRIEWATRHFNDIDLSNWPRMTTAEQYDAAWKFCHLNKESKYDAFMKAEWNMALASGRDIVLDRMNQSRKGRSGFINTAKDKGYKVKSVEFMASESLAKARQLTRGDKRLPDFRVHQIVMQLETPWFGPEVDEFEIVPCTR